MNRRVLLISALFLFVSASILSPLEGMIPWARAADSTAKDFYQGKRMRILVQYAPGGSFDIHARWMARHLPKFTGAKTIVQNIPGGGGVIGYNKLYKSRPDGLSVLTAHTKVVAFDLFKRKGVRYDFNKFTYLGRTMAPDTAILVKKGLPTDLDKLRKMKRIRIGASSPFYEGLMAEALGLSNISVVPGYGGFSGRIAAILRGELDATMGSITGALKFKDAVDILALVEADPRMPEAPTLKTLNAAQPWLNYLISFSALMRATVSSPNVDPRRSQFLQKVLRSLTEDPAALKEAKRLKLQITWDEPGVLRNQAKVFTQLKEKEVKNLKYIIEKKYLGALN
jgi:tripartite-type tricarboxylate transporter receptor subunit TctC